MEEPRKRRTMIPPPSTTLLLPLLYHTLPIAHASHPWWSRLIESHQRPANRRSHSATVYRHVVPRGGTMREWMVVSGGFTDEDWTSFPVWAFDLTDARSAEETADAGADSVSSSVMQEEEYSSTTQRGPWIDLTGLGVGGAETWAMEDGPSSGNAIDNSNHNNINDAIDNRWNSSYSGPQGRVGHLSSIYNDCLYIFGGLTYSLGAFHVENDSGEDKSRQGGSGDTASAGDDNDREKNTMIVWKACGLQDLFTSEQVQQQRQDQQQLHNETRMGLLKWEKIVPRVDTSIFIPSGDCKTDKNGVVNDHSTQTASKDGSVTHMSRPEAANTISRGEAQGGHYSINSDGTPSTGDCFILYGGIHRQRTTVLENGANAPSMDNDVPLGDVWKYDYETETLSLLAPYPPLDCQRDHTSSKSYPMARTSHSGTIIGDRLVIHGGMGSYGEERNNNSNNNSNNNNNNANEPPKTSSFSSSSSYATYKTSPKWAPLADTWEFDLKTLRWKERVHYPQLARSYHSLVGWPDGRIAAFGGFQQDSNIGGETVAFVFKDVIVSRANETHWLKLQPPFSDATIWRKYHYKPRTGIPNRLEHTAVVDQFGSMYVWGGRFQSVRQIAGVWRLDLFNSDANLQFELAQPDGIEQYEAELETLHLFIATMMFVSLTLSSFFSMMQQRQAREAREDGNGTTTLTSPRRGGLTRQVIDALPLKHYEVDETPDNNASTDIPCCPICLLEYEEGCEVRSLPCHHDFCRECIDPWLESHTSCPACRQLVDSAPINQSTSSSWAVAIGRMYSPNRRGYRNPRRHDQELNDLAEAETFDNSSQADSSSRSGDGTPPATTDGFNNQGTPLRLSWFNPMLTFFSRRGGAQPIIVNDSVETIELV